MKPTPILKAFWCGIVGHKPHINPALCFTIPAAHYASQFIRVDVAPRNIVVGYTICGRCGSFLYVEGATTRKLSKDEVRRVAINVPVKISGSKQFREYIPGIIALLWLTALPFIAQPQPPATPH